MLKQKITLFLAICLIGLTSCASLFSNTNNNFRTRVHQDDTNIESLEDIEAEIIFGKNISARILGQFRTVKNKKLNRYINLVGKSIATHSSRDDIEFHFSVLDADFINAYSAPGGYVFITRGAIKAMRDESELAAVLSHEIAHITLKHIVDEFKIKGQDTSATAGLSNLLGSSSSAAKAAFTQAVDNAVSKLLNKGFKKQEELDADNEALLLLASTGYDTASMSRYLKRIKKSAKNSQKKPTHPATKKRIQAIQNITKKEGLDSLKLPRAKSRFKQFVKNI